MTAHRDLLERPEVALLQEHPAWHLAVTVYVALLAGLFGIAIARVLDPHLLMRSSRSPAELAEETLELPVPDVQADPENLRRYAAMATQRRLRRWMAVHAMVSIVLAIILGAFSLPLAKDLLLVSGSATPAAVLVALGSGATVGLLHFLAFQAWVRADPKGCPFCGCREAGSRMWTMEKCPPLSGVEASRAARLYWLFWRVIERTNKCPFCLHVLPPASEGKPEANRPL